MLVKVGLSWSRDPTVQWIFSRRNSETVWTIQGDENMWETMVVHMLLGVLSVVIKNPSKAAELKTVLLQVRDTINEIYPS
jgi:hypothetical protein